MSQTDQSTSMSVPSMPVQITHTTSWNLVQRMMLREWKKVKESWLPLRLQPPISEDQKILPSGRSLSQVSQNGSRHGVKVALVGTLSALQWQELSCRILLLTSILVALTLSSPTTTMRSPRAKLTTRTTTG